MTGQEGFRGRLIVWCDECGSFYPIRGGSWPCPCPKCGRVPIVRRCYRCGYEWTPRRFDVLGSACPSCRSPYWNRTRTRSGRCER